MIVQKAAAAAMALAVIIGTWRGYLALFNPGAEEPRQIFPTMVEALPPADQAAILEGILVRNDRDLQQLLEDFLS